MADQANPQEGVAADAQNPLADHDKLNAYLDKRWDVYTYRRSWWEALWFRDNRYVAGSQWLTIDRASQVVPRPIPSPEFPRAVTNRMVKIHDDLVNAVVQGKFPFINKPATDKPDDAASAKVQDRFDDVLFEEAEIPRLKKLAAAWLVGSGNVFIVPWYDYDPKWGMNSIDMLQCASCGNEWAAGDPTVEQAGGSPVCPTTEQPQEDGTVIPVPQPLAPTVKQFPK